MKEYTTLWHSLRQEMKRGEIFDGFVGALLYATLIFLPIFIMIAEAFAVYVYLLTLWIVLIIIALFFYVFVIHLFWHKSLKLKNPELQTNVKKLFMINVIAISIIILILGIIFYFVFLPMIWI